MKLLTWNCAGAFRKKTDPLASFHPDLAVIQECERPEKLIFQPDFQPASMAWFGDPGAAKGIGVYSFSGLQVEVAAEVYDPTIRHCVPLRVTGDRNFHLDYCFAPTHWSQRVTRLSVGDFAEWRPWSDHCPLFLELDV